MKKPDVLTAIEPVVKTLESLNAPYYIGGSIASSAFGIARATIDIDIVSDLQPRNVDSFVEILKNDYYVDKEMLSDAIRRRSSFNIIHLETMLKVDIFIAEDTPFYREIFKRRKKDTLEEKEGATEFYFASPEDIILKKLEWFKTGGEVSERQLTDVLGILKVQRDFLDKEYIKHWAAKLGVLDLLKKVFRETGTDM